MKMRNYFRIWFADFSKFHKGFRNLRNGLFCTIKLPFSVFFVHISVEEGLRQREPLFKSITDFSVKLEKKVLFRETGVEIFTSIKFYDKCPPFLF